MVLIIRKLLPILLFMTILSATAQNFILPLWTEEMPNFQPSGETEKIDSTDAVRISFVQEPTLAVYLPSKRNISGRAVIICPGGGYARLAYDWEGADIAKWLNSHGIVGVVLKYRLPNSKSNIISYESPLSDAKRAITIVRDRAADWGIEPNKIGIMGFSAGGHLASTLGTKFDEGSRPDFMALIYPVITMDSTFTHMGSRTNLIGSNPDPSLIQAFSNELQVTEKTPPTFLVHSADDKAVPVENSLKFYQSLIDAGIPVEMHLYPYGGHGYSLAIGRGHLSTWTDRFIEWLSSL